MATTPTSMSNAAASSLSMLRLSGLASGMDTESMVTSLMRAERVRYDKMVQKKQVMDWTKAANLEVNNMLKTFRDTYLSSLSQSTNMMSASSILVYKVTADSNSSVTFSATKDAFAGSHVINSITSIASGAHAASAGQVSAAGLNLDTQLSALALGTPLEFDGEGKLSFSINGETFSFNSTDSLRKMLSTVNVSAKAGVQMSYSSLTGKFTLNNKTMGSATPLVIQNLSGNAFGTPAAGEDPAVPGAFGIDAGTYSNGADAVLSIDGVSVTKSTNTFTIDGVTYNLKDTASSPVKFTVEQDVDTAVSNVKKFVDAYNKLITDLTGKLTQDKEPDYAPLTDEQRSQMTDDQITKWEEKAKSGLLHNDSYIKSLLQGIRREFYDNVTAAGTNAAAIGLGTISYETGGTILVDETKLRQALQNNPQQVADLFTATSKSTDPATKYKESGLASRMLTAINGYINDYSGYRTDSFNDQYKDLTTSMTNEQTRLTNKENRYWAQFTRMEEAIAQMNQQSAWLSQQFSGNSNG